MAEFSDLLKKQHNLTDGDVKRIMALYEAFSGERVHPYSFIDAPDKLHKLGWHHDDEVAS